MSIPEKDADGKYLTANRGVTSNTALWHVRMALNVAALNCDKYGATARNQYNQILAVRYLPSSSLVGMAMPSAALSGGTGRTVGTTTGGGVGGGGGGGVEQAARTASDTREIRPASRRETNI